MSGTQTIGLTTNQRDLLLQGLRYVRSSVLLEILEPTPEVAENRDVQLHEIACLVEQLGGSQSADAAAHR